MSLVSLSSFVILVVFHSELIYSSPWENHSNNWLFSLQMVSLLCKLPFHLSILHSFIASCANVAQQYDFSHWYMQSNSKNPSNEKLCFCCDAKKNAWNRVRLTQKSLLSKWAYSLDCSNSIALHQHWTRTTVSIEKRHMDALAFSFICSRNAIVSNFPFLPRKSNNSNSKKYHSHPLLVSVKTRWLTSMRCACVPLPCQSFSSMEQCLICDANCYCVRCIVPSGCVCVHWPCRCIGYVKTVFVVARRSCDWNPFPALRFEAACALYACENPPYKNQ